MVDKAVNTSSRLPDGQFRINRRSLHDEVVERLRDMIIGGYLEEGERLPEQELVERFGISRTPLREAFKVLASEGLLELLPNRGARVAKLSLPELEQMFEVAAALEGLAGEWACEHITEAEVEEIRGLNDKMIHCYERNDFLELFKIDQEIHRKIVEATRNQVLENIYASLAGHLRRARFKGARHDAAQKSLMDDHVEMVSALAKRDGSRLGQAMRQHVRKKGDIVRETMSTDEKVS